MIDNERGGTHKTTPYFVFQLTHTHHQTLIMGAIYSSVISCIIYRWIILPRKERRRRRMNKEQEENNSNNSIKNGTTTTTTTINVITPSPYLVGFGIVMPLCAVSPYYYLRYFGIKNKIIKFLAGVAQLTSFFRCSEGKPMCACVCLFSYLVS
jgi:hypothetical protein